MTLLEKLPLELILKIFHIATFEEPNSDTKVPLALSGVSKDCRAIVSSEHALWTTIKINNKSAVGHFVAGATTDDIFPSLAVYLRNSGALPLKISIDYAGLPRTASASNSYDYSVPRTHGFTIRHAAVLSVMLLGHLNRLESFTVRTESWEIYSLIVNRWMLSRFPAVTSWKVEYSSHPDVGLLSDYPLMHRRDIQPKETILTRNSGGHTGINQLAEIGQRCFPSLRRFRLHGTPHGWFFSIINLVELVIQNIPIQYRANDNLLQIILWNSRHTLQVLELDGCLHAARNVSTQRMSLPAVHTLKVGFGYIDEVDTLLRIAQFPVLTDLSLRHLEDSINNERRHQLEMVELFQKMTDELPLRQLMTLRIDAVPFPPKKNLHSKLAWASVRDGTVTQAQYSVVMRFISELTALQMLTLVRPDPFFLQCMGYSPPSSSLFLPSLKKLRFETSIPKDCLHIAKYWRRRIDILEFLSNNAFAGPGLERLELLYPDTQKKEALMGWRDDPQPYAMSMGVEFQPEYIPFLVDEEDLDSMVGSDEDSDEDDDMDED